MIANVYILDCPKKTRCMLPFENKRKLSHLHKIIEYEGASYERKHTFPEDWLELHVLLDGVEVFAQQAQAHQHRIGVALGELGVGRGRAGVGVSVDLRLLQKTT